MPTSPGIAHRVGATGITALVLYSLWALAIGPVVDRWQEVSDLNVRLQRTLRVLRSETPEPSQVQAALQAIGHGVGETTYKIQAATRDVAASLLQEMVAQVMQSHDAAIQRIDLMQSNIHQDDSLLHLQLDISLDQDKLQELLYDLSRSELPYAISTLRITGPHNSPLATSDAHYTAISLTFVLIGFWKGA